MREIKASRERAAFIAYEICAKDVAKEQGYLALQAKVSRDGFFFISATFNSIENLNYYELANQRVFYIIPWRE